MWKRMDEEIYNVIITACLWKLENNYERECGLQSQQPLCNYDRNVIINSRKEARRMTLHT